MPLRDLFVAVTIFGSLPFCLMYPWIGVLMWSWIGYMNPHRLTFGFAYGFPWAWLVAVCTLTGLLFTKDRRSFPWTREVWFLLAFWAWMTLTTLSANYPEDAWAQWDKVSKIFLMTGVSLLVMQEATRVRLLVWVMGLSIGFYGLKGGVFGLASGGVSSRVLGPEGSFIGGNTEVGLAFNMVLPLLLFLRRDTSSVWIRHGLSAVFAFTVVATVFTFSRGAVIALAVILPLLVLKSRRKLIMVPLFGLGLWALTAVTPPELYTRVETIRTYEHDGSAMGRIEAWRVAIAVANDSPLVGGGFRTFSPETYERYGRFGGQDAHSIFFQVLGEHGYPGLVFYVGLIVSTLLSLRRLGRKPQTDPTLQWLPDCARMVEVAIVGYLVAGAFLSMSYFDYFYGLVAVTVMMKTLDARGGERAPSPPPSVALARQPRRTASR